jgi:hypothetical protein
MGASPEARDRRPCEDDCVKVAFGAGGAWQQQIGALQRQLYDVLV